MNFMFIGRLYLEAYSAYHGILVLGSTHIKQNAFGYNYSFKQGFLEFVDRTHVPMTKAQRICKNALLSGLGSISKQSNALSLALKLIWNISIDIS